jgi:hypothetical protein
MKRFLTASVLAVMLSGCAGFRQSGVTDSDGSREHGTTGLGVGSDTSTQTGIDSGTRTGSGLMPR